VVDILQHICVVVGVQVPHGFADDEGEFDFKVQGYSRGAQDGAFVGEENGGGGFEEEEGLFGPLIVEFGYVVGVVAAYADYLRFFVLAVVFFVDDCSVGWVYLAAIATDGGQGGGCHGC